MSSIINQVFENYQLEGINMPYTMEDFKRDYVRGHLDVLSTDERLKGVPANERLKGIPARERLEGLSIDELQELLNQLQADSEK